MPDDQSLKWIRPPFSRRFYLCQCDAVEKDDCRCWHPVDPQPEASAPQPADDPDVAEVAND